MGDTGSLFLGGLVVGGIFMLGEPLLIVLVGLVYFVEALSDIIQVGVFKLSGRRVRVFKMAPIHHHFENPLGKMVYHTHLNVCSEYVQSYIYVDAVWAKGL